MLLVPPATVQRATVELYRGAPIAAPGYWAVEDAYLDSKEPSEDHGGGFTLLGGDGRTILVRFGDLARAVGPGRRIVDAKLVLTPSGGETPRLKGVTAVDSYWGEGPWSSLQRIIATIESDPKGAKKPQAARGAATWTERRAGLAAWPAPGTPGGTPVAATGALKEKTFEIAGLGEAAQGWALRPWTDHGMALSFEGDVEFFSSQSPSGRPRLVLTTEPVAQIDVARPDLAVVAITKAEGKWTARLRNVGAAPSTAVKAVWWADGKAGEPLDVKALGANEEASVVFGGAEPSGDAQVPTLGFAVNSGDGNVSNDRLDVFPGGRAVSLRLKPGLDPQQAAQYWNETVAPGSRFSFAPEGVKGRVRLDKAEIAEDGAATLPDALRQIGTALGLPTPDGRGDLYPGLMGYGDTRFEGTVPGKLSIPYEPYPDPATETALLEPTGLLSATDVGRLNDPGSPLPLPRVVVLRVTDLVGRPLPGLRVAVQQPGAGGTSLVTGPTGTVLLPAATLSSFKPDLSNGALTVTANQSGAAATGTFKAWRVSDAFRRSGSPAVIVDARLDLPMLPLESETDLARGKPATDSAGATQAAFTDGDDATAAALPAAPGSWVEIDLGRDRTIGEIALRPGPEFWGRYEIRVYATGGRREDASLWAAEANAPWARANRAADGWITYRAPVQRIRYVRVVARDGGPASLAGLRVVPVKLQTAP